jgi:hypothetical protein
MMVPLRSSVSAHRKREWALPDANADDATGRQQKVLQVARAEFSLVCSVACKVAAVLLLLEGLFWIAALADPLVPAVFAAAAAGPQGAAPQRVPIARGVH